MSSFASALREFQSGACTIDQLETQAEVELTTGVAVAELVTMLRDEHAERPFEATVFSSIEQCIWNAETRRRTGNRSDQDKTRLVNSNRDTGRADAPAGMPPQSGSYPAATPPGPSTSGDVTAGGPSLEDSRPGASETPDAPGITTGFGASSSIANPASGPLEVGMLLKDRFLLQELVGSGGMSQVFRAVDQRRLEAQSRDPYLAVKVLDVSTEHQRDAFFAMQREAQKSQALNHPNILKVYDFDREGDIVFMTMQYLTGESLLKKINDAQPTGLPLDEVLDITHQIASALSHAHEHQIVHADFKPSNVVVDEGGHVTVIDFGIARNIEVSDAPAADRTLFDPRVLRALTLAYASPEMLEQQETDQRDDIYALGCVVYELFAGRHPFGRQSAVEARDHQTSLAKPPRATDAQWEAIRRALAFDRNKRTPTVRQFITEFSQTQKSRGAGLAVVAGVAVAAMVGAALWFQPFGSRSTVVVDCTTCPPLVAVAAGAVEIGSAAGVGRAFEKPAHWVSVAPFLIGQREVTVGEYLVFAEQMGGALDGCRSVKSSWLTRSRSSFSNPGFEQNLDHPATCVSWRDANAYVAWLSGKTGKRYRLPTEAEWEFAARSTKAIVPLTAAEVCGANNVADQSAASAYPGLSAVDCDDGFAHTAPVTRHDPTATRPVDMLGNVFEWTQDCWNPSYDGAPGDGSAWLAGDCSKRVLRGGSWFTASSEQRVGFRNRYDVDYRSNTFGFRVARDIADE